MIAVLPVVSVLVIVIVVVVASVVVVDVDHPLSGQVTEAAEVEYRSRNHTFDYFDWNHVGKLKMENFCEFDGSVVVVSNVERDTGTLDTAYSTNPFESHIYLLKMMARNMRPIILAMYATILSQHVPMLYGFTVPPQHQYSLQSQLPVGRQSSQNDYSQIQVLSNINSNINSRTNGIRIRHEFRAVNVEQENDTRQQTTSIDFGSNNNDFDNNNSNIYEILGIEEGQLALGVKPEEVYKYIGT